MNLERFWIFWTDERVSPLLVVQCVVSARLLLLPHKVVFPLATCEASHRVFFCSPEMGWPFHAKERCQEGQKSEDFSGMDCSQQACSCGVVQ